MRAPRRPGPYQVAILPICRAADGMPASMAVSPMRVPSSPLSPKKVAAEAWAETNGVRLLAGQDREAGGDALGRGDAAFVGAGLALLVRFEGGGAADEEGRLRRVGNPAGELGVEADALSRGGVLVEGGADGGDGVRARVGEEAGELAHRVQLVDGEVDLPLAGEEQVGGAGGRGGQGDGPARRARAARTASRLPPMRPRETSETAADTANSCGARDTVSITRVKR